VVEAWATVGAPDAALRRIRRALTVRG